MAYKHILIAVDLSPESKVLVEKAVSMARPYNAKVSLIHVDVNYSDLYTGLIDVNLGDMQKRISEETHHALSELSTNAGYPITETLSGSGDLAQVLVDAIKKYDMDLVLCGHHQDFWSKLMSSARQLINTVHIDMLIVPLRDADDSLLQTATRPAGQFTSAADGDDLAQLLYTSGTTSKPKGAMMSHRALVAEYLSSIIALDFTAEDRPLVAMPLYHSAAMHVFLLPYLSLGATVRLLAAPDIPRMLELVETEHIGSLFLAPTVWVPLANHPDLATRDLSSLRKAQYGASIMPVTVLQRLRQSQPGIGFYNCFGQSELGPLCTVLRPEEHDARPASCGRPVFHVEARVMTADGAPAAPGEPGEIQYRSPQLLSGYWNRPDATAEAFDPEGWFRTGDVAVIDADGMHRIIGRESVDLIKSGGYRIGAGEIETVLLGYPGVDEVAVVGVQVAAGGLHRGVPEDVLEDVQRDARVGHPGRPGVA